MRDETVGVIGLGTLGQCFVKHLCREFAAVVVYDLVAERRSRACAAGAREAGGVQEVGASADSIVLALPNPPAVRAALLGDDGLLASMAEPRVIVDASTIDPATSREVAAAAASRGVGYLDAPVSGAAPYQAGMYGAEAGTMTFMVGGDTDTFTRAQPIFSALGNHAIHVGSSGAGATVKLISNLCSGLYNLITAEAFTLGNALGIDAESLLEVFSRTDAQSYIMTDYLIPRVGRREYEPGFSIALQLKDHRLAAELGRDVDVPLFFNDLAVQMYQLMTARGLAGHDVTESIRFLAELAGRDIYAPNPEGPLAGAKPEVVSYS